LNSLFGKFLSEDLLFYLGLGDLLEGDLTVDENKAL
jgi:hypothetical protein